MGSSEIAESRLRRFLPAGERPVTTLGDAAKGVAFAAQRSALEVCVAKVAYGAFCPRASAQSSGAQTAVKMSRSGARRATHAGETCVRPEAAARRGLAADSGPDGGRPGQRAGDCGIQQRRARIPSLRDAGCADDA